MEIPEACRRMELVQYNQFSIITFPKISCRTFPFVKKEIRIRWNSSGDVQVMRHNSFPKYLQSARGYLLAPTVGSNLLSERKWSNPSNSSWRWNKREPPTTSWNCQLEDYFWEYGLLKLFTGYWLHTTLTAAIEYKNRRHPKPIALIVYTLTTRLQSIQLVIIAISTMILCFATTCNISYFAHLLFSECATPTRQSANKPNQTKINCKNPNSARTISI